MKTKLTITIDEDLLPEFKSYAASIGESLSQVIEDSVKEKVAKKRKKLTFAEKWRGSMKKLRAPKKSDPKWDYLVERYGLQKYVVKKK